MPPVTAPGADGRVDFVDEEDRLRPRAERGDDRLEALLEVAAETRARQQRAGVEREDLRVLQRLLDIVGQQARGEPFGHRGLADAGVADEDRIVLAAAAEDFDGALQFLGAADERIEQALAGARRQVDAVGGQRILRRWPDPRRRCRPRRPAVGVAGSVGARHLRDAVRDVFEDVEPRDALLGEQARPRSVFGC